MDITELTTNELLDELMRRGAIKRFENTGVQPTAASRETVEKTILDSVNDFVRSAGVFSRHRRADDDDIAAYVEEINSYAEYADDPKVKAFMDVVENDPEFLKTQLVRTTSVFFGLVPSEDDAVMDWIGRELIPGDDQDAIEDRRILHKSLDEAKTEVKIGEPVGNA